METLVTWDPLPASAQVAHYRVYRRKGTGTWWLLAIADDAALGLLQPGRIGIVDAVIRWDPSDILAAWLDFDNDGLLDLFVTNYSDWTPAYDRFCGDAERKVRVYCHPKYFNPLPNQLYRNLGDGTFEFRRPQRSAEGPSEGDFESDDPLRGGFSAATR